MGVASARAHERRLLRWLMTAQAYPHPVGKIVRRETHVSHVFLAGSFAYKLKKAVRFPFLDASTVSRRKRFCQLELTLNRRLAPGVYLGIAPIVETPQGLRVGGAGTAIEWVVKMRRLPEARMLDRVVARGDIRPADMRHVADRLIPFFKRAARSRAIDRYGLPNQVAALLQGNLAECQSFIGRLLSARDYACLQAAYRQTLALQAPVLRARVRQRRMIDGHGDLRCENICMTTPVNVFDCVEFQPAFRCGDIANDFSFLIMDLEFRGRTDLADTLLARYRAQVNDPTLDAVLPLYKCHRSLVRGKVRGLAWRQHPRTTEGCRVRTLARRHFQLALRYARQFARPRLIVVGGLVGTGKSTLAKSLAETFGAVWLRTDEIRLREFAYLRGRSARRTPRGFLTGLYAPWVSEQVYQRLIRRAAVLIRKGQSVVCDGTFSRAAGREALQRIARHQGASFYFFECRVPRTLAMRRVGRRYAAKADLSEAQPEHYDRLRVGFQPVRGWTSRQWTRLSTARAPRPVSLRALEILRRAWS